LKLLPNPRKTFSAIILNDLDHMLVMEPPDKPTRRIPLFTAAIRLAASWLYCGWVYRSCDKGDTITSLARKSSQLARLVKPTKPVTLASEHKVCWARKDGVSIFEVPPQHPFSMHMKAKTIKTDRDITDHIIKHGDLVDHTLNGKIGI
jgi:hypothetical protein